MNLSGYPSASRLILLTVLGSPEGVDGGDGGGFGGGGSLGGEMCQTADE